MGYFLATMLLLASLAPAPTTAENPWNGTWVLDASRSTPGIKDQAADAYRFTLQPDGQIKWEIPSLGEVVTGNDRWRADGDPSDQAVAWSNSKCYGGGS